MSPFVRTRSLLLSPQPQTSAKLYQHIQAALSDEVLITEIGIKEDKGRYQLPRIWRKLAGDPVVDFLESYVLDLGAPENPDFSIAKIWQALPEMPHDLFDEVSLADYFGTKPDAAMMNDLHPASAVEKFKNAEHLLLTSVLDSYDAASSYYQPIPVLDDVGGLERMAYLVYDKSRLSGDAVKALVAFRTALVGIFK